MIAIKIADGLDILCDEKWAERIWNAIKPQPDNKPLGSFLTPKTFFKRLAVNLKDKNAQN